MGWSGIGVGRNQRLLSTYYMPGTVSHLALKTALQVGIIIPNFEDLGLENQVKWHDFPPY